MNTQSSIISWVFKGLLMAVALVPLIVSTQFHYLYTFPKALWFEALMGIFCIGAGLWMAWRAIRNTYSDIKNRLLSVARHPITVLLGLIVVGMAISAWGAVDSYHSVWGDPERAEGLIVHLLYLIFVVGIATLFSAKEWKWYTYVLLGVGGIAVVYQWMQFLGITTPFFSLPQQNRAGSLLGSPTYMGSYAVMLFAVIGMAIVQKLWKPTIMAWVAGGASIIVLFSALLTQTRGALLGLAVGVMALLVWWAIAGKQFSVKGISLRTVALVVLAIGIVAGGMLFATRTASVWQSVPGISRFAQEDLLTDATAQTRLVSAGIALDALLDRPLFGWGGEHYLMAFNTHYDPTYFVHEQGWFDRAHNKVLDTAVMYGLVGLVLYLMLWGSVVWRAFRHSSSTDSAQFFGWGVIGASLIAYFVQNLFAFDMMSGYVVVFSVLAFFLYYERTELKLNSVWIRYGSMATGLGLIILGVVVWYWMVGLPFVQSASYINAINKDSDALLTKSDYFLYPWSYIQPSLRLDLMQSVKDSGGATDERLFALSDVAQKALEESVGTLYDPRPYQLLAEFFIERGKEYSGSYVVAEQYANKGLALASQRQSLLYLKAAALSGQDRNEEALALLENMIEQTPEVPQTYYYYASILAVSDSGQYSKVKEYLQIARDKGMPMREADYDNYMKLYFAFRDFYALAQLTQEASEAYPQLEKYHKGAVVGFRALRDADRVIEHLEALKVLLPDVAAQNELNTMIMLTQQGRWDVLDQY